jgi:hypothetical protein
MQKILFISIILILIIILFKYINIDFFQDKAVYINKLIAKDDVLCKKNVEVEGKIKMNELCIDDICIDENILKYIKKLPIKLKTSLCIGDKCINNQHLEIIKGLKNIIASKEQNKQNVFLKIK